MVQKTETTNDLSFYTEEQQKAMYFTETYTKRALSWLCLLQWPSAGDAGVTYLELFLDSYLTSGCYPINIAWDGFGFPIYKLLDDCGRDPSLSMRPRPLHQTLRAFEYSLKYIHKMFGDDYFPCSKSGQTTCLSHLKKFCSLLPVTHLWILWRSSALTMRNYLCRNHCLKSPYNLLTTNVKHNPRISDSGLWRGRRNFCTGLTSFHTCFLGLSQYEAVPTESSCRSNERNPGCLGY